jgi:hypothetical protein
VEDEPNSCLEETNIWGKGGLGINYRDIPISEWDIHNGRIAIHAVP